MNLPWDLGLAAAVAFFAWFEARAFRHPERQNTLSHFVASLGAKWPLSIWLMGLFAGVLAAHFFWPWCANPLGAGAG